MTPSQSKMKTSILSSQAPGSDNFSTLAMGNAVVEVLRVAVEVKVRGLVDETKAERLATVGAKADAVRDNAAKVKKERENFIAERILG